MTYTEEMLANPPKCPYCERPRAACMDKARNFASWRMTCGQNTCVNKANFAARHNPNPADIPDCRWCKNKVQTRAGKSAGTRKYTRTCGSEECKAKSVKAKTYRSRECEHCHNIYTPNAGNGKRWCPECTKGGQLAHTMLREYGMTLAESEALLEAQNYECGLCGSDAVSDLDHCHLTGIVRGWLCRPCNLHISSMEKDPEWALRALAWIARALPLPAHFPDVSEYAKGFPDVRPNMYWVKLKHGQLNKVKAKKAQENKPETTGETA